VWYFFGAVPTVWYFFLAFPTEWYFFELFQQCGIFWSCSNYHTVGTAPKNTTLLEQLQKIPHCWNSSKKYHTVGTAKKKYHTVGTAPKKYHTVGTAPKNTTVGTAPKITTLLEQLQNIPVGTAPRNTSWGAVPTVWYCLELFEQWYFLELFQQCGIFWSCSNWDFLELFQLVYFGAVPLKYTTLLEKLQNIPHCWNSSKKYHTVGTAPKNTTLLE
jgi:hypothetical protein